MSSNFSLSHSSQTLSVSDSHCTSSSFVPVSGPILITGAAAGRVGGVGSMLVRQLRACGYSVRALVRKDDERAAELRSLGAEIVIGDLTNTADVQRAVKGIKRLYFGMSVSQTYLEASVIMAAALLAEGGVELVVNMSQMTVSSMSLSRQTPSAQQRQHWLAEQTFNWSRLPVVHIRPTVFLEHFFFTEWAAQSIAQDGTIRLPFSATEVRTAPVAVNDVARVIVNILTSSSQALQNHLSKHVYELTGPTSLNMQELVAEYAQALGRPIRYVALPFDDWDKNNLQAAHLPDHVYHHIHTMAELHRNNEYNRFANGVEQVTGKPPMSVKEYVAANPIFSKTTKTINAVTVTLHAADNKQQQYQQQHQHQHDSHYDSEAKKSAKQH